MALRWVSGFTDGECLDTPSHFADNSFSAMYRDLCASCKVMTVACFGVIEHLVA